VPASRILLGLDFDGTLAPIVPDPSQAVANPQAVAFLSELSQCLQRLVIISGRDTDFLVSRLPLPHALFIGNHGLEERHDGASRVVAEAQPYLERLRRAADAVAVLPEARAAGITIERKRAAVSVHFRQASDPSASGAALQPAIQQIARHEHLQLQPGRLVWELRPPIEIDKGAVLRRLAAAMQPAAIVYAGDDRTDAKAFLALRRMTDVRTVAVGVRSPEVPDAVFVDCDLTVDGVPGVILLLTQLLDVCANA
jgi:trehalose 6-phosphate phosphatase